MRKVIYTGTNKNLEKKTFSMTILMVLDIVMNISYAINKLVLRVTPRQLFFLFWEMFHCNILGGIVLNHDKNTVLG
jgi:hypothetical protein